MRFPVAQAGHYSLSGLDILIFFVFVFQDRASLCGFGSARTHFVDQAGLELRDPLASASHVLGLKVLTLLLILCGFHIMHSNLTYLPVFSNLLFCPYNSSPQKVKTKFKRKTKIKQRNKTKTKKERISTWKL